MEQGERTEALKSWFATAPPTMFERALAALPDGVLLTDFDRRVIYTNPAFAEMWKIPARMIEAGDEVGMLRFVAEQLVDPDTFRSEVERLRPTNETSEDELRFKDGRIFSRRSVPFDQDGIVHARIWIFTDITEACNARIDALTGLPNRRAYSALFPAYAAAPADGFVRSVALMDVDNFKKFNDLYGHAVGDAVLRQIGDVLRGTITSADDLVFRIGGEEFLLALRTRNAIDARTLFETVRKSVEDTAIPHLGNSPHDVVTVSFGLGQFVGARDPVETFRLVDEALYQAKADGRNCVRLVTPTAS